MKSLPEPVGVRPGSPTAEVIAGIDRDETAVVTGRYAGVGLEAVRTVTFAGRKRQGLTAITGRHTLKAISGVELKAMDLLNPASEDLLAEKFLAPGRRSSLGWSEQILRVKPQAIALAS